MPIFPYDDEEERRRRLYLAPQVDMNEPASGMLPEASPTKPTLPPPSGIPGGTGMPAPKRPTRGEELDEARDVYMMGTPGRGKSALKGAAQGFLSGGGLLGAITGGISGAVDPRGMREAEFERKVQPRIVQRFGFEDAARVQARQGEEDALSDEYRRAQIGELNRRGLPEPPKPPSFSSAPGLGIYNQGTGQVTTPLPPPQPKELTPHYEYDVDRLPYNLNNPEERKRYESLPKGKRVKPEKTGGAAKPKKEQKFVPLSKIREYAKQRGISRDAAEAEARADGYTIVR